MQVSPTVRVTILRPATVQTDVVTEVRVTANPDEAVAPDAKVTLVFLLPGLLKVIV